MKFISARAFDLAIAESPTCDFVEVKLRHALSAIDEWQKSVEERMENDSARLILMAVFALAQPGGSVELINELLERAGFGYRVCALMRTDDAIRAIMTEAEANGITRRAT